MSLTREQILGADDLRTKAVDVPEWGGPVRIRELSARESADWVARSNDPDVPQAERGLVTISLMLVLSVIDGEGKRIFTDEDIAALQAKNPEAIRRVFDACLAFNGATAEELAALEKN